MVDSPNAAAPIPDSIAAAPAPDVAPGPVAQPAAESSPLPAPIPETPAEPTLTPTLLEKFEADKAAALAAKEPAKEIGKPAEAKPGDKPADKEAAKPEAEKPAEPVKPEPVEYKYTLPETIKMDDALKGQVHEAFDALRSGDAQKLFDIYAAQRQSDAEQTLKNQFDVFNKTKETWEKAWLADPEIGGAGHNTAMGAIARTRDLAISSAKIGSPRYNADRAEFDQFLAVTGAGSHPVFGRLLHNLARFIDEPQAAEVPTNIRPPKNIGKAPKGGIYTHPSSANMDK